METEELRKAAQCVYLATEKSIADDIAGKLNDAAELIDKLDAVTEKQDGQLEILVEAMQKEIRKSGGNLRLEAALNEVGLGV